MATTPSTEAIGKKLAATLSSQLASLEGNGFCRLGVVFETKDADAPGPALLKTLEDEGRSVEVGCVWTHKRTTSLGKTLVEISRSHLVNFDKCSVVAVVHPGPVCVDTLKAVKAAISRRMSGDVELVILASDPFLREAEGFPAVGIAFCDLGDGDYPEPETGNEFDGAQSDWSNDPFGPDHYPAFIQDRIRAEIARSAIHP